MTSNLSFPSMPRVDMFKGVGSMSLEWQNFFRDLFTRVGASEAMTNVELEAEAVGDQSNSVAGLFNTPANTSDKTDQLSYLTPSDPKHYISTDDIDVLRYLDPSDTRLSKVVNVIKKLEALLYSFPGCEVKSGGLLFEQFIQAVEPFKYFLPQTVWDDLYFEIAPKTVGAGKPTLASFSGNIKQWTMAVGDITELRPVEIKHNGKEGSPIEVHVHWGTNGVDGTNRGVKWEIDYTWANTLIEGGTTAFAAATTVSAETQIPANTPDKTHMYTSVVTFTPTGGKIGSNILMSLKRIASVTNPTPTSSPWVFMVGVHYEINTVGSRTITNK